MPVATSYSEAALAAFIVGGSRAVTAAEIGWTTASDAVFEAVGRVERILAVSDVAAATNMEAIEAVARFVFWRAAAAAFATDYDLTTDGQLLKRSQRFDHAVLMRAEAARDCLDLGITIPGLGSGVMRSYPISSSQNPYAPLCVTGAEF